MLQKKFDGSLPANSESGSKLRALHTDSLFALGKDEMQKCRRTIRKSVCLNLALAIFFCASASLIYGQDSSIPEAGLVQTSLKEWVKTKQLISSEGSNWAAEKESLADLNLVRKRETLQLSEFIKAAGARVLEIEEQKNKSTKEKAELKAWRLKMESQITSLEKEIKPLISLFPPPLRANVEEAVARLESSESDRPLQHRTRDLLLVMQAYLNFKNTITLDVGIQTIDGKERKVEILYMGMTQAWYVDKSGKYSGYAIPSKTTWIWTDDPTLASSVRQAIEIQSQRTSAEFVKLPIRNGAADAKSEK